jgi:putative transposase
MKNHVHIIATPRRKGALSKAIGRTHFAYTQYINSGRKNNISIWRNRFQSCALDSKNLWTAVQFVETRPVQDKLVRKADKYAWSSAAAHISGKDASGVLALSVWPAAQQRKKWAGMLSKKMVQEDIDTIRTYTQTGRPLGSEAFYKPLEKKFKRRLHPLPVGRPPQKPD